MRFFHFEFRSTEQNSLVLRVCGVWWIAWCVACGMVYDRCFLFSTLSFYSLLFSSCDITQSGEGAQRDEINGNGGCFRNPIENRCDGTNFQQCRLHPAMLKPAMLATSQSFRAAFLSSWACAEVRLMATKESMAPVSLRPSSPICAIQLACHHLIQRVAGLILT